MIRPYDPAPQKVRNHGIAERVSNSEQSQLLPARQSSRLDYYIECRRPSRRKRRG
jgi:hypothetical protein